MNSSSAVSERCLYKSVLIAKTTLSREYGKIDAFFLLDEANKGLIVILFCSFKILFGLSLITTEKQDLSSNQPELAGIFLRNGLKHVIENLKCALVVSLTQSAYD